ncbi:MAG: bifunctional pyr operon transcriptional regulator/uracil phosphoribosyltransferase PyrR [Acidimicrobiia bacterium]
MPAPPNGGVFRARTQVMSADDVNRAITRIAHEILERNHGLDGVAVIGMQRGGVWLAERLGDALQRIDGEPTTGALPIGALDVALYRDDIGLRPIARQNPTMIPFDLNGRHVVLVDDVLFTGRTVRAALNAVGDFGRPRSVQLAVMIDRGHRELPIRPDFVGKNLPTRRDELVRVSPDGVVIGELVHESAPTAAEVTS